MSNIQLGTVTAISGTTLTVTPDGSVVPVSAVDCAGAQVGDRVVMEYHATQLLAVAIVGGPHGGGGDTPDDYVIESGAANGWTYQKWHSGAIEAWSNRSITWTASLDWILTVPTPVTMKPGYMVWPAIANWKITKCYAGNRTTTQFEVAAQGSDGDTAECWIHMRGEYA